MGLINCVELDLSQIPEIAKSLIKKDSFFDELPTLNQKDLEKWAEPIFQFKVKIKGEWYLGSFYNDDPRLKEISLSFSKFQ